MIAGALASNDFQALVLIIAIVSVGCNIAWLMEIRDLKRELIEAENKYRLRKKH